MPKKGELLILLFSWAYMARYEGGSTLTDLKSQLAAQIFAFGSHFDDQVRNQPRAYGYISSGPDGVNGLSKRGITMLQNGHDTTELERQMRERFEELKRINLPVDMRAEFVSDAGQEFVEFYGFKAFYFFVIRGEEIREFPFAEALGVLPQVYLSGMCDVPGELFKAVRAEIVKRIRRGESSLRDKHAMWERLLKASLFIHDEILAHFIDVPPRIVNGSRRRFQGFKFNLVPRVKEIIERIEERLFALEERVERETALPQMDK